MSKTILIRKLLRNALKQGGTLKNEVQKARKPEMNELCGAPEASKLPKNVRIVQQLLGC